MLAPRLEARLMIHKTFGFDADNKQVLTALEQT